MIHNTEKNIQVVSVGTIGEYNRNSYGCYMVESTYSLYILEENKPLMSKSLSLVN